jgi:SSS family solute:Na+ symporter
MSLQQEARDAGGLSRSLARAAEVFADLDRLQRAGEAAEAESRLHDLAVELEGARKATPVLETLSASQGDPAATAALAAALGAAPSPVLESGSPDFASHVEELEAAAASRRGDQRSLEAKSGSETPRSTRLSMVRTSGAYTWWIMLLGYPIIGIWYWCADQTIVQRVLGARSERDARIGPIFAGFIKVLPVFLMVFPGVIAYVLFRDTIGDDADATLSVLILELLPRGMQGLVLAGLLAAMMSTVAGALNSTATLVSIDIVQRLRPATADRTLVRVGQATAVMVMVAAMAWSTQGDRFGGIFAGINQMISVLAPPITTVFLWGVFWRRGTSAAAFTTLLGGFALGAVVFVADFPAFGLELITREWGIPFLLQAWILFVLCSAVYVVVSLLTPPPARACVDRYCWPHPLAVVTQGRVTGLGDPRVLSLLLILVMAGCYSLFA